MEIDSVVHKGLRRFIETGDERGVKRDQVKRLSYMIAKLVEAADLDALNPPPGWRLHPLTGDRAGEWSISVSGNWRLTFRVEGARIYDLNLEDYH